MPAKPKEEEAEDKSAAPPATDTRPATKSTGTYLNPGNRTVLVTAAKSQQREGLYDLTLVEAKSTFCTGCPASEEPKEGFYTPYK